MAKAIPIRSNWIFYNPFVAGIVASGLLLSMICIPLSWFSAVMAGEDPIAMILLLQSQPDILAMLAKPSIGSFGYRDVSVLAALLGFYGLMALALPLILHVAVRDGFLKLLTLTWGMTLGLTITLAWFEWSITGSVDVFSPSAPKIFYLYLVFLVAEAAKLVIEHKGLQAIPYTYLIDGLFGTVTVLIIQAGYELALESLLLAPFFLIAVAIAIVMAEWLMLRPMTIVFVGLFRLQLDRSFERRFRATQKRGIARLQMVLRHLFKLIRKAGALSYAERVDWLGDTSAKLLRKLPPADLQGPRFSWSITASCFALNLSFVLVAATLGWLIF